MKCIETRKPRLPPKHFKIVVTYVDQFANTIIGILVGAELKH